MYLKREDLNHTVCARFGLECVVYMGALDMERHALNVFRMRLLGAEACDLLSALT